MKERRWILKFLGTWYWTINKVYAWSFSFNKLKTIFYNRSFKEGPVCESNWSNKTLPNDSLQKEAPPSAPAPRTKSSDPGSARGSDEIHLSHGARWKQHWPSYYKQMELQRNGNLQTICMTRCSLSIMAPSIAAIPFCVYRWLRPFLPQAKSL